ncbi:MAG: hypothetical protein KF727_08560 [Microbacteriaceae bacterium]|nr:hypothetical protein [Microbacteriaceae bacterium]
MKTGARLALYGAGLVVAFGGAFGLAGVIVPNSLVDAWAEESETNSHGVGQSEAEQGVVGHVLNGLSLSADGYVLSPLDSPRAVGVLGEITFQVLDELGEPVTEFTTAHGEDLHLIVVRTDGAQFHHVHPELTESTGIWSAPWAWGEAGTYRVYADFTPTTEGASSITLTRTVEVAGDFAPVEKTVRQTTEVDGFTVALHGDLVAGSSNQLTISITRDGEPVRTLEPYLGAFGHLVALREGDLAYLHVHAEGEDPTVGATAGPDIAFAAEAPTAGRYLLYLDFQVDGEVHTAEFILDATHGDGTQGNDESHSGGH